MMVHAGLGVGLDGDGAGLDVAHHRAAGDHLHALRGFDVAFEFARDGDLVGADAAGLLVERALGALAAVGLTADDVRGYGKAAIAGLTIQDWGVTYDEVEHCYDRFEYLCGVSGKAGNLNGVIQPGGDPFEGPRGWTLLMTLVFLASVLVAIAANLLIGLREGLEATLIVSILLAHVTRLGRTDQRRSIWLGTVTAVLLAFSIGIGLQLTSSTLSESAAELFAGSMGLATVGLVTWMIFWMAKRARAIRGQLEHEVESALSGSGVALAVLAFVSVIREGLETALFLWTGITATGGADDRTPVVGASLGLAAAMLIGVGLYRGALKVDLAKLFRWSGAALVVVHHWNQTGTGNDRKQYERCKGRNAVINCKKDADPIASVLIGCTRWIGRVEEIASDDRRRVDPHDE